MDKCFICGRGGELETHHCLHGIRRKAADKYGLTVKLCRLCHKELHDRGLHDLDIEQHGQRMFEEKYGHDRWMQVFGKNYL